MPGTGSKLSGLNRLRVWALFAVGSAPTVLRIEKVSEGGFIVLKLSGRIEEEHLAELRSEIEKSGDVSKLDLRDINLVDRSSVRFLIECKSRGIELVNPPLYVREWMLRERKQGPPRRH
jgi:ABC-type transporter Mla MlaB component